MAAEGSTSAEVSHPDVPAEDPASFSYDDADSAFGASISDMTDTTSMGSSIQKYRQENGRTYHAYGSREYWGPNDDAMLDHLDIRYAPLQSERIS